MVTQCRTLLPMATYSFHKRNLAKPQAIFCPQLPPNWSPKLRMSHQSFHISTAQFPMLVSNSRKTSFNQYKQHLKHLLFEGKGTLQITPCFRCVTPTIQTDHPYIHPMLSNGNIFLPNNSKSTSSEKRGTSNHAELTVQHLSRKYQPSDLWECSI